MDHTETDGKILAVHCDLTWQGWGRPHAASLLRPWATAAGVESSLAWPHPILQEREGVW